MLSTGLAPVSHTLADLVGLQETFSWKVLRFSYVVGSCTKV